MKIIKIAYCCDCPYYRLVSFTRVGDDCDFKRHCTHKLKPLDNKSKDIPAWCPLEDYKKEE